LVEPESARSAFQTLSDPGQIQNKRYPVSATVKASAPVGSLSEMVKVAVFGVNNVPMGEWNRTLTVQLAPGAKLAPQVVPDIVKSVAFGPLIAELIGPVAAVQ